MAGMSKSRRNTSFLPLDDVLFDVKPRKPVPHEFVLDAIATLSPKTRSKLVGQKLAAAYPKEATAMISACIVAAQLVMLPIALLVGQTWRRFFGQVDKWSDCYIFPH